MRMIRTLSAVAISGAMLAAATGCASAAGDNGAASDELTYWSMWKEGESQQKIIASAIDDFEADTGIKVNVQWQGRDNTKKVVPTLNTNKVPDLIDGSFAKLAPILAETGQAKPLASAFSTEVDGSTVRDLIPSTYLDVSTLTVEGDDAPWLVPYSLSSDAFWFNAATRPDLVENPPKTWSEFTTLLDSLKAAGEAPIAIDGDVSGYNAYWTTTAMVRVAGPGSLHKAAADPTGKAWDSPEALEAAKLVQQLVDGDYFIDGYDASKWPAQQQLWADNQGALLYNGTWIPNETASYAADGFKYGSFPFPGLDAPATSQRADFVGFAVPSRAKNSEAAQKFAAYFLGKKYQDRLGEEAKIIPIRADATVGEEMAAVKASLDSAESYYQQNDGISFPGYSEKLFWPLSDQLVLGKLSAEEFVAQMKAEQIEYWKQNS